MTVFILLLLFFAVTPILAVIVITLLPTKGVVYLEERFFKQKRDDKGSPNEHD